MRTVVPFDGRDPKSRLAPVLSPEERREFAAAMLRDVLATLATAGAAPEVLSTTAVAVDAPVSVDERALDPLIDEVLADAAPDSPVAVVMADLPLATSRALDRLLTADGDVVVVPGRGGGTNALVVRHPGFTVDYHGASYLDHLRIAAEAGASVREIDSMRLSTDVDGSEDLAELLLFGEGAAVDWLRDAGFELVVDGSGVAIGRDRTTG